MTATNPLGDEQTKLWNGTAGHAWVDMQELIDSMYKPLEDMLVAAVSPDSGGRVLDIGCGTGGTTLAVARRLGAQGRCLGIDISDPMLATARARAEREGTPARFVHANAQSHVFEPASFDQLISRFGVMFFDDPVRAFTNLRSAARDGAELRFIAWRSAAENPFMTTSERTAAPLLPNLPARRPGGPGQFAFADPHRVQSILEESGWAEVELRPIDVECAFPEKELVRYLSRLGPVGMFLQETDERTRTKVVDAVRVAFEPFVHGTEVRFTAACWWICARAPSASVG
ncbi:class I SAM-dependent methyltransferase [Myxococcus sp. CA051A]|uniref:Class I SAM-dependent methyltransferase n=1 Tax=Myxococcus llanfairpwllgwyngyllgogerychwyrndrobwllllantysiliogogogochensis TaxID=2590453 RepID=A0A540WXT5_9BACT|nr:MULTISPECIES: class I SAM-dependent methyltransferase [Myxococcus]NTX60412.1 class I SAM-dependent methyltransferase [Myxococcus sp. CA051A]TQF13817.1 class I SAM-dependent methyltransferase [Myxococcus llanfairpwllgwyngyllgogerychwyrndrobwllllantysiliogogogochensis]